MIYSSVSGLSGADVRLTEEELQQIGNLFATVRGSAPCRREFGIPAEALVGVNADAVTARLAECVGEALRRYIPRVEAKSVRAVVSPDGRVSFTVELRLADSR
jgi:phage baseplate assembly protein W